MKFTGIRMLGVSLSVGLGLLYPLGCDRSALQYAPPQRFTWDHTQTDAPIALAEDPTNGTVVQTAGLPSGGSSETGSKQETSIPGNWVATSNIQSDVRTSRAFLPGPLSPPDSNKFNEIATKLATSIDQNQALPDTDFMTVGESAPPPEDWEGKGNPERATPFIPEPLTEIPEKAVSSLVALAERTFDGSGLARPESSERVDLTSLEAEQSVDEGDYRLGAGDSLDISIWDMPDLARALIIRPDGYISFPLIKEIKAAGLTPSQLENEIETRLADHLLEPEASVVVTSFASKVYYVFGAVVAPGMFPFTRDTTLLQAIISVGGFGASSRFGAPTPYGDLSRIRIIRTHEGGREVITKNLKGLSDQERLAEDIPIQPDDIIYIPEEENLVFVFGEILSPGIIPIGEESRVLEAILASGGTLPTAQDDQVLLIRQEANRANFWCLNIEAIERGSVAHNLKLQNGDIVYVPQKPIAKLAEFVQLYASALQPAMETYLTAWDTWFVHERFSALRKNDFGVNSNRFVDTGVTTPNVDR